MMLKEILLILMIGVIPWIVSVATLPMPENDEVPSVLDLPKPQDAADKPLSSLLDEKENVLMALILQALVDDNSSQPKESVTQKPPARRPDKKLAQAFRSFGLDPGQWERFQKSFVEGSFSSNPDWESLFKRPFPMEKSFPFLPTTNPPVGSGSGYFSFKNNTYSHFKNMTYERITKQCKGSCSILGGTEGPGGTGSSKLADKPSDPLIEVYISKNNTHYHFKNRTYEVLEAKCTGNRPCSISGGTGSAAGTGNNRATVNASTGNPTDLNSSVWPFPQAPLFPFENGSPFHFKNQTHEVSAAKCTGPGPCSISGSTGSSSLRPSMGRPDFPFDNPLFASGPLKNLSLTNNMNSYFKNATHEVATAACTGNCSISGGTGSGGGFSTGNAGGSLMSTGTNQLSDLLPVVQTAPKPDSPVWRNQSIISPGGITILNSTHFKNQTHEIKIAKCYGTCCKSGGTGNALNSSFTAAPELKPQTNSQTTPTPTLKPRTTSKPSTTVKPPTPTNAEKPLEDFWPRSGSKIKKFFLPSTSQPSPFQQSFQSAYKKFQEKLKETFGLR